MASTRLGSFILDHRNRVLSRDGVAVSIQPKVFDCLELLARKSGELTTLDELRSDSRVAHGVVPVRARAYARMRGAVSERAPLSSTRAPTDQ